MTSAINVQIKRIEIVAKVTAAKTDIPDVCTDPKDEKLQLQSNAKVLEFATLFVRQFASLLTLLRACTCNQMIFVRGFALFNNRKNLSCFSIRWDI